MINGLSPEHKGKRNFRTSKVFQDLCEKLRPHIFLKDTPNFYYQSKKKKGKFICSQAIWGFCSEFPDNFAY